MLTCKLCGESLYQNINFTNLFKQKRECHLSCLNKLEFHMEESIIPIDYNLIVYEFVFENKLKKFDEAYLELKYLGFVLCKHLKATLSTVVLYLDDELKTFIENFHPYLIFMLSKRPIIIISLWEENLSIFEKL